MCLKFDIVNKIFIHINYSSCDKGSIFYYCKISPLSIKFLQNMIYPIVLTSRFINSASEENNSSFLLYFNHENGNEWLTLMVGYTYK
jgi:hypothetical protein